MLVVDYIEMNASRLPLDFRVALWLAADVFLLTPIREGINLMPLEYIYARRRLAHAGVVIASEFSTSASVLNGSIKVNPFNTRELAEKLEMALNLTASDSIVRRNRDLKV